MSLGLFLQSLGTGYVTAPPVGPGPVTYLVSPVLSNHSYSWWCGKIAFFDPETGAAYFTTIGNPGTGKGPHVLHRWYNGQLTSIELHTGTTIDEHNTPALLDMGTHLLLTYTGHNISFLWVRQVAKDLSTMSAELNINGNGFNANSYTQLYKSPENRALVFTRKNLYAWAGAWSDDAGSTWSGAKDLINKNSGTISDKLYMTGQMDAAGIIRFAIYHHPTGSFSKNEITYLELNSSTGDVVSGGVTLGNYYSPDWVPVSVHSLQWVFRPVSTERVRLLDITTDSTHTYLLTADFVAAESGSHYPSGNYRQLKVNRQTLAVEHVAVICPHGIDTYSSYFGGCYYSQSQDGVWDNRITVAREENGTWYLEVWTWDGSAFTKSETIKTSATPLTRPQTFTNSHLAGAPLCMVQEEVNDEDYTTWSSEISLVTQQTQA